jgi:hypothetical protein
MKTFRIKVYNEDTCRSSFEFIFLKNCKSINLYYSQIEQSTRFELNTMDEKIYTLSTIMKPLDFQLFELKFKKFQSNEDLFFDLGNFSA